MQEPLARLFEEKRPEIWSLYEGFELLDEGVRRDMLRYYEDFYRIIGDEGRFDREIKQACRG